MPPRLSELPNYPVIGGLALLSIGVTVTMWLQVDVSPLFASPLIRRGEWWRLITDIFPHAGILHLAFNVYWVWVFGTLLEEEYGHLRTAGLILLFAIGSSAFEFAFISGGIGLSGVGYGLFGLLWMLARYDRRFIDAIDGRTIQLFVIWFFFCIITTVTHIMRVANLAHGAGLVIGILAGIAIAVPERRLLADAGLTGVLAFGIWAATAGRPSVNLSGTAGFDEARWGYQALSAGRYPEAARWFRDAATYHPTIGAFWYDLGLAYRGMGNQAAALDAYRKAADRGEGMAQAFLGSLYENGTEGVPRNAKQAVAWYEKAAAQGDSQVLNNVAWAYATSSNPEVRNPRKALELARKAVSLEKDHPVPSYLDTLAEACYINGLYEEAVQTEQQAIALAPEEGKKDFQASLEKYQKALEGSKQGPSAAKGAAAPSKSRK